MTTQNTTPVAADDDLFETNVENLDSGAGKGDSSAWKATAGVHTGTCVAIVDLGEQVSNFAGQEKKQRKIQLLFALNDQDHPEIGEPITIATGRLTASMFEMSALAKMIKGWGIKITKLSEMIGQKAVIIVKVDEEKGYHDIQAIAAPMKNQVDPERAVFIPKYWREDAQGVPTGYRIVCHPTLAINAERPKKEG